MSDPAIVPAETQALAQIVGYLVVALGSAAGVYLKLRRSIVDLTATISAERSIRVAPQLAPPSTDAQIAALREEFRRDLRELREQFEHDRDRDLELAREQGGEIRRSVLHLTEMLGRISSQ